TLKLSAAPNELSLYNVKMAFGDNDLDANFKLTLKGEQPSFDLLINANSLDADYFTSVSPAYGPPIPEQLNEQGRWPQDLFDFSWLSGYRANLDLNVNKLMVHYDSLDQFKCKASIADEQLHVERLTFQRFGGKIDASGVLTGGKV